MSIIDEYNFTFLDIETPNRKNASISSIALINVSKSGEIKEEYYLVNPEERFDDFNIQLTGITPSMVKDKPNFKDIWYKIKPFIENSIVVAHNATFDLLVLSKCCQKYNIEFPKIDYLCTLDLSRVRVQTDSYKLNKLCEMFDIKLSNHHHASDDTNACMELFFKLNSIYNILSEEISEYIPSTSEFNSKVETVAKAFNSLYGILKGIYFDETINEKEIYELKKWLIDFQNYKYAKDISSVYSKIENILTDGIVEYDEYLELIDLLRQFKSLCSYTDVTLSMQVFMGLLRGIIADETINIKEATRLDKWMNDNIQLKGNYPFDKIFVTLEQVLEDGIIKNDEHQLLIGVFNEFLNPKTDNDNLINFNSKLFCLTGTFEFGLKSEIASKIVEKGGLISNGVTKKVDYLVVGGEGSESYKFGKYGSKVNKALQMQEEGHKIQIISEKHLMNEMA